MLFRLELPLTLSEALWFEGTTEWDTYRLPATTFLEYIILSLWLPRLASHVTGPASGLRVCWIGTPGVILARSPSRDSGDYGHEGTRKARAKNHIFAKMSPPVNWHWRVIDFLWWIGNADATVTSKRWPANFIKALKETNLLLLFAFYKFRLRFYYPFSYKLDLIGILKSRYLLYVVSSLLKLT